MVIAIFPSLAPLLGQLAHGEDRRERRGQPDRAQGGGLGLFVYSSYFSVIYVVCKCFLMM